MWPEMESFCGQRPEAEKNFYCRSYSDSGWPRFLPLQQHPFLRRLGAEVLWERERKGGIETGALADLMRERESTFTVD